MYMTSSTRTRKRALDGESNSPAKKARAAETIKICTWNINHIARGNPKLQEKFRCIVSILDKIKPDLLVLQEVNEIFFTNEDNDVNRKLHEEIQRRGYKVDWGPKLKVSGTQYVQKTSTQYEYYPIFYLKEIVLLETSVIQPRKSLLEQFEKKIVFKEEESKKHEAKEEEAKEEEAKTTKEILCEWTTYRPVVLRKLKKDDRTFFLGIVHTSPTDKVQIHARDYIQGTLQLADKDLWILAGDWYVKNEDKITVIESDRQREKEWQIFLLEQGCNLFQPLNVTQTNFPENGQGMIADYFVTSSQVKVDRDSIQALMNLPGERQPSKSPERTSSRSSVILDKAKIVKEKWASDHIPVVATFEININRDSSILTNPATTQSIFPSHTFGFTYALSNEPVLLNGMKVIFDQPVGVYPVNLKSKDEAHRNGT